MCVCVCACFFSGKPNLKKIGKQMLNRHIISYCDIQHDHDYTLIRRERSLN